MASIENLFFQIQAKPFTFVMITFPFVDKYLDEASLNTHFILA